MTQIARMTPVITAGAYSQNDVMGGLLTFPVPGSAGGGFFNRIAIVDRGQKKNVGTLYLFDDLPATIADNAAIGGLAVADLNNILEDIDVASGDWGDIDAGSRAKKSFDFVSYDAPRGNIYGYFELTNGSPTNPGGTDEITFLLFFLPREVY